MADEKYVGQDVAANVGSDFNAREFHVKQLMRMMSTATLVKVVKNTVAGVVGPVGFVDVEPLVNMLDGDDKAYEHGTVYSLPYFRLQGGADKAVIMDPKPGDIGMVVFADRDISSVKKNKARSNPGSRRRFDMADGMFVGCFLSGTPTSYVQFMDDGSIKISPNGGTSYILMDKTTGDITIKGTNVYINPP